MTEGLAAELQSEQTASADEVTPMNIEMCSRDAIIPEPGCEVEEETEPDPVTPPPSDGTENPELSIPLEPDYSVAPSPVVANVCQSLTENPHLSSTIGYAGRINVKTRTTCAQPANLTAAVGLYREKCTLWVFCGWVQIAYGEDRRFGTRGRESQPGLCVTEGMVRRQRIFLRVRPGRIRVHVYLLADGIHPVLVTGREAAVARHLRF